ncbi:hypothetical protein [Spirosoma endbachense]|uniref:Uncharacterized protein n=1 Tax=Spirosoma endbachense TaxID=2666025 RepID=A0A6P1VZU5_9BACT|nr:hypothetical protein [Spirosoma endbachense]QHV97307.1 hypothetical protein GJR95_20865 [Spirosoma endbachense]
MVQAPDYEEFENLKRQVHEQGLELSFLRSLLLQVAWLDRAQTMKALDVSHETLRRIHLSGELRYRYKGDRPFYCIYSVRDYLIGKKISPEVAQRRVLAALFDSPNEKPTKAKRNGWTDATK